MLFLIQLYFRSDQFLLQFQNEKYLDNPYHGPLLRERASNSKDAAPSKQDARPMMTKALWFSLYRQTNPDARNSTLVTGE